MVIMTLVNVWLCLKMVYTSKWPVSYRDDDNPMGIGSLFSEKLEGLTRKWEGHTWMFQQEYDLQTGMQITLW